MKSKYEYIHGTRAFPDMFDYQRQMREEIYMSQDTSARLKALIGSLKSKLRPLKKSLKKSLKLPALILLFFQLNIPVGAVAPHPKVIEKLRAEGKLQEFYQREAAAQLAGVNAPVADPIRTPAMLFKSDPAKFQKLFGQAGNLTRSASAAAAIDTIKVLVILAEFTDNPHDRSVGPYTSNISATPAMFDSVLFSTASDPIHNVTGSMTDYYMETSYGTFFIQGVISGWHMMPKTYSNYLGSTRDGLSPTGPNAQDLASDAIQAAFNSGMNFAQFDKFGPNGVPDGKMDGVFIIHAGTGYEESFGRGPDDIRSHKWQLKFSLNLSGVSISSYTMEPEETFTGATISPIGVFCHEFGHFLGLPDLYDTDGTPATSEGLGRWSIMASGNFLGSSRVPAGYDCWSKAFVGFLQPIDVNSNLRNVTLRQVYDNQICYKLTNNTLPTGEYFLVENRQKVGFDEFLPGSGLLIYHVDQAFNSLFDNNDNENRYQVALEQADGFNQLAFGANNPGDGSDPFSLTNGFPEFHDLTTPDSRSNDLATTQIAVWDISASGPNMTANLDISYSRPYLTQFQATLIDRSDGDGILEPGENYDVSFSVKNLWATGVAATVTASSPNPDITFTVNQVNLGTLPGLGQTTTRQFAFRFRLANTVTPRIDSIYFNFVSEGGLNNIQLGAQIEVGPPQALIVNSDQNGKYTEFYSGDLFTTRLPHRTHVISTSGLPTSSRLAEFPTVIWYFGDNSTVPPSAPEIQRIKTYLDGGGNLMISGMNLAEHLSNVDSTFMHNYLHAVKSIQKYDALQRGVVGSRIGDGITRTEVFGGGGARNWTPTLSAYAITPVNGAQPEFKGFSTTDRNAFHAISFSGANKVVFFSFPFESLGQRESAPASRTQRDEILSRVLQFFGDIQTDVGPDDNTPLLPQAFALDQNYPNPFNPTTTISYTINNNGGQRAPLTELFIYNTLGQQVRQLVSRVDAPGSYQIEWDGADDNGSQVSSGIYFYRLKRGDLSQAKKMALLK